MPFSANVTCEVLVGTGLPAPVFASSSYTDATQTLAATITEENPDTLYWALVTNPSTPSAAQIIAGSGGGILEAGSESYVGGFSGTISVTNEAGDELHLVATDTFGNQSTVEIITGITVDNTVPVFSTSSPADNATGIAVDAALTVTFTDTHALSLGAAKNFYIYEGGVLAETIATSACSILSGVVTIPHAAFTGSTVVSVRWDAGAVVDAYGNAVAANTGDTVLNFTTAAATGFADITVELASTAVVAGGGTSVVPLTGAQEGDLAVVYRANDEFDAYGAISGYATFGGNTDSRLLTDYKIMGASPDASVTVPALSATLETAAIVLLIRGADTLTPWDISEARSAGLGGNSDSSPAVTTITDKAMVIAIGSLDDDTTTITTFPSGYINTTERNCGPNDGATGSTLALATKIVAAAGLETPSAWLFGAGDFLVCFTHAIRPKAL